MVNRVNTYDPKKVIVTFGGVPLSGFTDGTFVQIDPNTEGWTKSVGADGEVVRSFSNDNTHTVQITLQQTSASNDYLSTIHNTDKMTGNGVLPLTITDLNGTTLHFWAEAWISTDPSWGFGNDVTERQWTFHTGQQSAGNYGGGKIL